MRHPLVPVVLAAAFLTLAEDARADVIVRLKSGSELYASHTWTENGLVKFEHRGGVVGFPEDAVESVTEANASLPMARAARPVKDAPSAAAAAGGMGAATDGGAERPPITDTQQSATAEESSEAKPAEAKASAAAPIDTQVPEVKGEDLTTRMERLDDLSVKTHRELSVARSRGDPKEVVDALQAKVDEINRQRVQTAKSLRLVH